MTGVMVAGMVLSAAGTLYSSQQQAQQARAQEKMSKMKARLAASDANKKAAQIEKDGHRMAAKQTVVAAAGGADISDVNSSPYELIQSTINIANKDAQSARNRGSLSAAASNYEADAYSDAATGYVVGGVINASANAMNSAAQGSANGWW